MPDLRILVGEINSEWAHILERLVSADPGMKIVGQVKDPLHLLVEAKSLNVDVVVVAQLRDGSEPGICSHLMLELPNVVMVLVPALAENRSLVRMVLWREQLPATETALYAALRGRSASTGAV